MADAASIHEEMVIRGRDVYAAMLDPRPVENHARPVGDGSSGGVLSIRSSLRDGS